MSLHKLAFAIAVATVAYTAVSGVTKAASIAPLPAAVTSHAGDITPAYYYHALSIVERAQLLLP